MYTSETEKISQNGSQQLHKVQPLPYTHLIIAICYTLLQTYVVSILILSKNMAVNLFVYGVAMEKTKNSQVESSAMKSDTPMTSSHQSNTNSSETKLNRSSVPRICLEDACDNQSAEQAASKPTTRPASCEVQQCNGLHLLAPSADVSARRQLSDPSLTEHRQFAEYLQVAQERSNVVKEQESTTVSACDLVKLLNNEEPVLLLDCRTFMAYNANHIVGAINISCSDRITRKRLSDGKISVAETVKGAECKEMYQRLENSGATVIVYDENTMELSGLPANHSLSIVTKCLSKQGKHSRVLQGGLQGFQQCYSTMCSQPDPSAAVPILFSPTSPEVNCDIDNAVISEILPHVLIGNHRDASDRQQLHESGITHILNVTSQLPLHFESDGITYLRLSASDSGSQNLKQYFTEAINFIESAREANGRVLVHCQAGVSRSPTIVLAYLIARSHKSLTEAFSFVKDRRPIVAPNLNFMGQLLEFSQLCEGPTGLCPPSEPVHLLRL